MPKTDAGESIRHVVHSAANFYHVKRLAILLEIQRHPDKYKEIMLERRAMSVLIQVKWCKFSITFGVSTKFK